jgi:hypothetical protein
MKAIGDVCRSLRIYWGTLYTGLFWTYDSFMEPDPYMLRIEMI